MYSYIGQVPLKLIWKPGLQRPIALIAFFKQNFDFIIQQLFIASYYRQLFADNKIKNYKIKTVFVSPEDQANKIGIYFMILILIFAEKFRNYFHIRNTLIIRKIK